jgi:hypothetical protein
VVERLAAVRKEKQAELMFEHQLQMCCISAI